MHPAPACPETQPPEPQQWGTTSRLYYSPLEMCPYLTVLADGRSPVSVWSKTARADITAS